MTIQTPREAAETMRDEWVDSDDQDFVSFCERHLAARDRALLAADDAAIEAMAEGAYLRNRAEAPLWQWGDQAEAAFPTALSRCASEIQDRYRCDARGDLAALRKLRGVEDADA